MTEPEVPSPSYYQILQLEDIRDDPALSAATVKAAYKRALLAHHPDKRNENSASRPSVTIDDVALAYKILSEPALRRDYDRALRLSGDDHLDDSNVFHTGLDTVDLDDMDHRDASQTWTRPCRCGDAGGFAVTEEGLEKNANDGELIVGCRGCSLWLRVLFSVEV